MLPPPLSTGVHPKSAEASAGGADCSLPPRRVASVDARSVRADSGWRRKHRWLPRRGCGSVDHVVRRVNEPGSRLVVSDSFKQSDSCTLKVYQQVECIESSVHGAPPDDLVGAMAVSGAPRWEGEVENSLPAPCTDSEAHLRRSVPAGEGAMCHWRGTFRPVEGRGAAVAVRSRAGQAL